MIDLNEDKVKDVKLDGDSVGGSSYIKDSDCYDATVVLCYYGESDSGAAFLDWKFKLAGFGFYQERIYISKNKANGQSFTYTDRGGAEKFLPGYQTCFNMTMAAAKMELIPCIKLANQDGPKKLMLYDFAQGKEVEQEVEAVLSNLAGKTLKLCIKKKMEPNSVKTKDDKGKQVYVDSANETRDANEIDLVCMDDGRTINEVIDKVTEPEMLGQWTDVWKGKTHNIKPKKKYGIEPIESIKGKPKAEADAAAAAFGGGDEEAAPETQTSNVFGD